MISRLLAHGMVCALAAGCTASPDAQGSVPSDVGSEAAGAQPSPGPDSVRLMEALSVLAHDSMEGRAVGTTGNEQARAFLVRELEAAGVEPLGASFEHPFTWDGGERAGVNVVGRIEGPGPSLIVLSAHFDHLGIREGEIFNGTDDNASGTAVVLEIARLVAATPLRSTLVIALFDAEEAGLGGARAFVSHPPLPLSGSTLNVNLDMVSRTDGVLWAAGAHHTPALRPILERVAADAPVTLRLGHDRPGAPEGDDWTGASDHGPFHDEGISFVYFGVEDHPDYHRATDDYDRIDPAAFVAAARTIYAAIRALDSALPLPETDDPR